jgi:hypothetical protein
MKTFLFRYHYHDLFDSRYNSDGQCEIMAPTYEEAEEKFWTDRSQHEYEVYWSGEKRKAA